MANNSIKYDFQKGAVIMEDGGDYKEVSGGLVMYTAAGATGTEDGANTWAKIATFTPPASDYSNLTAHYTLIAVHGGSEKVSITVKLRQAQSGVFADESYVHVDIDTYLGMGAAGVAIEKDCFKLISDSAVNGAPVELWMKKLSNYRVFSLHKNSVYYGIGEWSVAYHNLAPWQSAVPSGAAVNVTSDWGGTGWVIPSLLNGWVFEYGGGVKRLTNGLIIFDMRLSGGTDDAVVFNLPVGFRPWTHAAFLTHKGSVSAETASSCYINGNTGDVYVSNAGTPNEWVSLQFSFMAEN